LLVDVICQNNVVRTEILWLTVYWVSGVHFSDLPLGPRRGWYPLMTVAKEVVQWVGLCGAAGAGRERREGRWRFRVVGRGE